MKKLALAYCADNLPDAQAITKALQHSNYEIQHFDCKSSTHQHSLADQIAAFEGTAAILLISDNFLKSISCMNRALHLLQQKTVQILPVITDGFTRDENTGEVIPVTTQFERIGDIIPYINYWQNQYLDLRSQKKKLELEEGLDHEAFNTHLRMLREVSSEASEFLRLLRNTYHLKIETLFSDDFKALFEFLEDEEGWQNFVLREKTSLDNPSNSSAPAFTDTAGTDLPAPSAEAESGSKVLEDHEFPENFFDFSSEGEEEDVDDEEEDEEEPIGIEVDLPLEPNHHQEAETFKPIEIDAFPPVVPTGNDTEEHPVTTGLSGPDFNGAPPSMENTEGENNVDEEEYGEDAGSEPSVSERIELEAPEVPEQPDEYEGEIEEILLRAVQLANAGNYADCLGYLQHAVTSYPNAPELRYHYALVLAQNGNDYGPALEQLNLLLEQHPDDEQANFLAGELHELQHQNDQAVLFYSRVAEVNPEYQDIFYRLGFASLHCNPPQTEKAARYFKRACKANPRHVDAHYQYALLCAESQDRYEKAVKYLEKTLELNPEHPFANYDLAMLHHRNNALGRARKCYLRATAINPELRTHDNDLAFGVEVSSGTVAPVNETELPVTSSQEQLIQILKENIAQLEQILQSHMVADEGKKEETPRPGKTVLITGASSGIGKATAEVFARHGFRLILTARRAELLYEVCHSLHEQHGAEVFPLVFDVRQQEEVQKALNNLPVGWQDIDILVNNAGKAKGFDLFDQGRMEHWEEMIDTNIKGLLYVSRAITPGMVARKKGHIINIGSIAGKEVYPKGNVYCASKAAVDALTTGMRLDLHQHHIRVSQVNPGHVEETEFALVRFDGDAGRAKIYEDFKPLSAMDVAETIFFIASQPDHVNIQDVVMFGTQQASATVIDRSGR